MTERKPPGDRFETWVDKQIRTAYERGEFNDLEGTGKPLRGLADPYDELWWVKNLLEREGLSGEALLPTPLQLRKEIERLRETVRDLPTEQDVRAVVSELNHRIVEWIRAPSGPPVPVMPVDADEVVEQWARDMEAARRARAEARAALARQSVRAVSGAPAPPEPRHPKRRLTFLRRVFRIGRAERGG